MRLLLVEDDADLAAGLRRMLTENGFAVDSTASAGAAMAALDVADYDLVILDLFLPDAEGTRVLSWLRDRRRPTPVLIVSAASETHRRVQALDAGADDFLVKPFALDELRARIRAILRRPTGITPRHLVIGNVTLDTNAMAVRVADNPIELSRRDLTVLRTLMSAPGRRLRRREMLEAIYSLDDEVTGNAIEAAVSRLRRRLAACGASVMINTVRGFGYTLTENA